MQLNDFKYFYQALIFLFYNNNYLLVHSYCFKYSYQILIISKDTYGGARGVMDIVVGIGHGDTNPGWDWLDFT